MSQEETSKLAWNMIGIKITFVTASFGFIFFDYLIVSYGISIKRVGYFSRSNEHISGRLLEGTTADDGRWRPTSGT